MTLATFAVLYALALFALFAFGCIAGTGATLPDMVPVVAPTMPRAVTMPRPPLPWAPGSTREGMLAAVRARHAEKAAELEAALKSWSERQRQIDNMMNALPLPMPRDAKGRFVRRHSPLVTARGGVK